jgi:ADP-dependent NAD(P)H-hydrate dehydratase / NAD(P)H-hydrate epimerase
LRYDFLIEIKEVVMRVVTGMEMREVDRRAIKEHKIPSLDLMEAAGRAVAHRAEVILQNMGAGNILVVAGTGNNGGDGFVAARYLHDTGHTVTVLVAGSEQDVKGDAAVNLKKLEGLITPVFNPDKSSLQAACVESDLVIDAIFGTGFHGKTPDAARNPICVINNAGSYVLAVDVPSGVDADTGRTGGAVVEADETITFGLPKLGCVIYPGAAYTGKMTVVDIGLPPSLTQTAGNIERTTPEEMAALLPARDPQAHKKSVGRVLVIAGSRGMTGAAALTAMTALRAGAGLVTLACPATLQEIYEVKLTEVMTVGLSDTGDGALDADAVHEVLKLIPDYDVLLVGPGLGRDPATVIAVRDIVAKTTAPLVLDADGLNALATADGAAIIKDRAGQIIITPHPGELARLTGKATADIQTDRLAAAAETASELNVITVLKGAATVVSAPDRRVSLNSTGNPGMASAGTGDVLAGLIGGLWAQHMSAAGAAILGAHLHGAAGDLAALDLTEYSLVANDLLEYIPDAFAATIEAGTRPIIKSEEE